MLLHKEILPVHTLDFPNYARIHLKYIPQEYITEYNLTTYAHGGWVYFRICKGVYGLPQVGKLANNLLRQRLATKGYYEAATIPRLWLHKWCPVMFCLNVDDFGIKYVGEHHTQHLLSTLQEHFTVTTDWEGKKYSGIDLKWNYKSCTYRLTMKDYIRQILLRYGHQVPRKPQRSPHQHREVIYGARIQNPLEEDTSPILYDTGIKHIQGIFGTVLYHA